MFTLQDIPSSEELDQMAARYPDANPRSLETILTLLRVGSDIMSLGEAHFADIGISTGRFMILMLLNRKPEQGASPSELAERGGVSRATITGLLDNLERDELVIREHGSHDRRSVHIRITDKGIDFLGTILPAHFRRMAWVTSSLSNQDKTTLITLLGKILQKIQQIDENPEIDKSENN
jgi:DNA-binding MarR family transcriptional regulator